MKKQYLGLFLLCICMIISTQNQAYATIKYNQPIKKETAIIIDDLGNGQGGTDQLFSVSAPLTVAIMPFLKTSRTDAIRAHQAGFEVILHVPMEPMRGKRNWLGPGAITTNLTTQQIKQLLRKEIESIPYVKGMNNHMGSKATSDYRVMKAILEVAKEKHLYVVDSVTTPQSITIPLAKKMGVPCVARSVFIDNENRVSYMKRQLQQLINHTATQGWGVGIGHVGHQGVHTMTAIRAMLPVFKKANISLVPVSKVIKTATHFKQQKIYHETFAACDHTQS
ncbi:hypothetical protein SAMN05444392_104112 [Seinonella peptonophila]|uniref:Divergent polysaccharide deacetylase n=1 Tax=Seinonella peptonophila TaxID=112248 RepID=A0A1M4X443_9BACL|nr:divergent polysaccharide deacetylase family protein [Seinonella peptonophila]SHE88217.1 hypothetical protein SAMN05444392_104112 [Seinonella peptonophila]